MLLQFSVKNFRSIKDRVVLSMETSSDKSLTENYVCIKKDNILKSAAIFGANAAGKSNIFLALTAAILTLRRSNERQVGEKLGQIIPFLFDEETATAPTEFEFVFFVDDIKYVYGFSATSTQIVTEYLYVYKSIRATTIFERDENGLYDDKTGRRTSLKYRFTSSALEKKLKPLVERNSLNKLFLATSSAWNCEETKAPMLWFMNSINTYSTKFNNLLSKTGVMYENDKDQSLREFVKRILREADINITDYELESHEVQLDALISPQALDKEGTAPTFKSKAYKISTFHSIVDKDGKRQIFPLDMHLESLGTQQLFFISPIIKNAFDTGETVCVDEFDTSMHPLLVKFLIKLFHNPALNKKNAQLIISTHTESLLDLSILRRDQIYFVDKDQDTGVSELYSLDDYTPTPRITEDIRKGYMNGRFGAVPYIREEVL
ncbi:MAG: ATP/GTP-binding protein [Succinivibrio sp.]